jgi:hypothetical protein
MLEGKVGDRRSLLSFAEKAYLVALDFEEVVTKEWISSYLNGDLPIDALCHLSLKTSALHVDDEGPHLFSVSHSDWLSKLRRAKLSINKKVPLTSFMIDELYESFQKLQALSMSHPSLLA